MIIQKRVNVCAFMVHTFNKLILKLGAANTSYTLYNDIVLRVLNRNIPQLSPVCETRKVTVETISK